MKPDNCTECGEIEIIFDPDLDEKPSLLVEYVKAKKSKICPLIEFTD